MKKRLAITIGVGVFLLLVAAGILIGFLVKDSNKYESSPVVEIFDQGEVRGKVMKTRGGRNYFAYLGIPYAEPAVRFRAPTEPKTKWNGTRETVKSGPICTQIEYGKNKVIGQEDCLNLDVYTPDLNGSLPVMFYIYASGFTQGHATPYTGEFFLDEDVILVTHNYRVGAFGFLCTEDGEVQGNFGLKDQNMALRWVRRNIANFGGDPNRVTIFGSSAGSGSVSYHILSPLSNGLFQRAIMQGGSSLNPWAMNYRPSFLAVHLANLLGCPTTSRPTKDYINCIREKDQESIMKVKFSPDLFVNYDPHNTYTPCVERSRREPVFLSEFPYKILKDGNYNRRLAVILGIGQDEGLLYHAAPILTNYSLAKKVNDNWSSLAPETLLYDNDPNLDPSKVNEISKRIQTFYFRGKRIGNETRKELIDMYSDRWFIHGIHEEALLLSKYSTVYPYFLSYNGGNSGLDAAYGIKQNMGVAHGDDIQYFFNSGWSKPLKPNSDAETFSKNIVKLWASFAKTGVPSVIWSPPGQRWSPMLVDDVARRQVIWLDLNQETKHVLKDEFKNRLDFWTSQIPWDRRLA